MRNSSSAPAEATGPLLPEHIAVGRLLWYSGDTSTFSWNCPAVITWTDPKNQLFRVRSLDDMREQSQCYAWNPKRDCSPSRKHMRLVTPTEVAAYLEAAEREHTQAVAHAEAALARATAARDHFKEIRSTLSL